MIRALFLALLTSALCASAVSTAAATDSEAQGGVTARAAASCRTPKYPGSGYFNSLQVTRVDCATGRKLALAYYRCRVRAGGADGRCRTRVLQYRCVERRQTIPTQISARVTCTRGTKRIVHTYQQDT